jgi:glutamyl-tRNA synthetase
MTNEELSARIKPFFTEAGLNVQDKTLLKVTPLIRERLVTLDDCLPFASFFFKDNLEINPDELIAKGLGAKESAQITRQAIDIFSGLSELTHATGEPPMRAYVEKSGFNAGQVFGVLRVAITGQKVSPPLFESMEIIGRDKVLERLQKSAEILEEIE